MRRLLAAGFLFLTAATAQIPLHRKIATSNKEAQSFFDEGLFRVYAFDFPAAQGCFRRAIELDPECALCYWGLALSLGPNYNAPVTDPANREAANTAARKAASLAGRGPAIEEALATALTKRFSSDESEDNAKLANAYRDAMRTVHDRFPKDEDAAALYVESILDLHPWELWNKEGAPAPGTEEAVAILQDVLKHHPGHLGAHHYLIHAVEASPHPEIALSSAEYLKDHGFESSHLLHMPGHIYMRTGDYAAAIQSNEAAVSIDQAHQAHGMYALHNLQFLSVAATLAGRSEEALRTALDLERLARPMLKQMPAADEFLATRFFILTAFRRWPDILRNNPNSVEAPLTEAVLHFARGVAYANTGKLDEAADERHAAERTLKAVSPEVTFGQNSVDAVFAVAFLYLDAEIAMAQHDPQAAKQAFRKAGAAEDALRYDEPPAWFIPVRERFGGFLLSRNELPQAEVVFRRALLEYPKSGRALFGLAESLKRQGKLEEAKSIESEFKAAWAAADKPLTPDDL